MWYNPKAVESSTYCSTQKEIYKLTKKLILTRTQHMFKLHEYIGEFNE